MELETKRVRKDGNHWRVDCQHNGIRKSFYSTQPQRYMAKRELETRINLWLQGSDVDVHTCVADVWEAYCKDITLTAGNGYVKQVKKFGRNYILPECGKVKVLALTEGMLQKVIDKAYKYGCLRKDYTAPQGARGLSHKTLCDLRSIENSFIKWARHNGYTELRLEGLSVLRAAQKGEKRILQPEAIRTLFSVDTRVVRGKRKFDDMIYLYRFAVATGLRPGEIIGLQIGDISRQTVQVRRSINQDNEVTNGKNANATRNFALSEQAHVAFQQQIELLRKLNYPTGKRDFLFPVNGQKSVYDHWKLYQRSNDLPGISLYEMRHTYASYASCIETAKAIPMQQLKQTMGHSESMDTARVYVHPVDGDDQKEAQVMSDIWSNVLRKE
jgi:integrase